MRSKKRITAYQRAISKHKKTRKIKRRRDIVSRRWRHPKTGAHDKWALRRARKRLSSTRISRWLRGLEKKMTKQRQFTIGKKVNELATLLGNMSVKTRRRSIKKR